MTQATVESTLQPNDINLPALMETIEAIHKDPEKAKVQFNVSSAWKGQTRIESTVDSYTLGGERIPRSHKIVSDEPIELLGKNEAPNPQELLFAAMNSCMMVGYAAYAAVEGIQLEKLEIETTGELDLRGFLGLDENVKPGYESLQFKVRIKGDATPEQFQRLHEKAQKTSVNGFNIANPIRLDGTLVVE